MKSSRPLLLCAGLIAFAVYLLVILLLKGRL